MLWVPFKIGAVVSTALKRIVSHFAGRVAAFPAFESIVIGISDLACLAAEGISAVACCKRAPAADACYYYIMSHATPPDNIIAKKCAHSIKL